MGGDLDVKIISQMQLDGLWQFEIKAPREQGSAYYDRWVIEVRAKVDASKEGPRVTWSLAAKAPWEGPAVAGASDWSSAHAALERLLQDAVETAEGRRLVPLLALLQRIREPWIPDIAAGPPEELRPAPPVPMPPPRGSAPTRGGAPARVDAPLRDPDDLGDLGDAPF